MKCPVRCIRCGRLTELHKLRHGPDCKCRPWETCANLICQRCYKIRVAAIAQARAALGEG